MKSYRKELWFNTPTRLAFVNITGQVQDCIRESGVKEGLALVNAMHITASVFINDDEPGLHHDYSSMAGEARAARARSSSIDTTIRARITPTRTSSAR